MRSRTITVSISPLPANIGLYKGMWVFIRGSEVQGAADTLEDLLLHEDIENDDALYHVPYGLLFLAHA